MLPSQWVLPSVCIHLDALQVLFTVLHDIAWHCMVLHGIAWYCMLLHGTTCYCMVLYFIVCSSHLGALQGKYQRSMNAIYHSARHLRKKQFSNNQLLHNRPSHHVRASCIKAIKLYIFINKALIDYTKLLIMLASCIKVFSLKLKLWRNSISSDFVEL